GRGQEIVTLRYHASTDERIHLAFAAGFKEAMPQVPEFKTTSDTHPGWLSLLAAIKFARNPSKGQLVETLNNIADNGGSLYPHLADRTPWMLGACLNACVTAEELRVIAKRVDRGQLGDT